jgi:hypothetical protein
MKRNNDISTKGLKVLGGYLAPCCAFAMTLPCCAAIIVSDPLNGAGTDDLNGRLAVVSQGVLDAGGNAAWVANTSFKSDGSLVFPTGSGVARLSLGDYIWNARGTESGLFTLTSTIAVTSGNWISVGFFRSEVSTTSYFSNGEPGPGMATAILRSTDVINYYPGKGVAGNTSPGSAAGPVTFTITLDLRSWNGTTNFGTVKFLNDKVGTERTANLPDDEDLNPFLYVGFSGLSSPNGSISNFSLSQVPEPSLILLLSALPLMGFRRSR